MDQLCANGGQLIGIRVEHEMTRGLSQGRQHFIIGAKICVPDQIKGHGAVVTEGADPVGPAGVPFPAGPAEVDGSVE